MSERPALEESVVRRAVERYGRTNPSPDDVLSERFPRYGEDPTHTRGYHAHYDAVMREVDAAGRRMGECRWCNGPLDRDPTRANANRRYCSHDCSSSAERHRNRSKGASLLEGQERAEVLELYGSGLSVHDIARALRVGHERVRLTIADAGLTRSQGRPVGSDSMSSTLGQIRRAG